MVLFFITYEQNLVVFKNIKVLMDFFLGWISLNFLVKNINTNPSIKHSHQNPSNFPILFHVTVCSRIGMELLVGFMVLQTRILWWTFMTVYIFFYSFLCLYLRVDDDDVHVLFTQYTLHVLVSIGKHYIVLVVKNVEVLLGKGEWYNSQCSNCRLNTTDQHML